MKVWEKRCESNVYHCMSCDCDNDNQTRKLRLVYESTHQISSEHRSSKKAADLTRIVFRIISYTFFVSNRLFISEMK